MHRSRARTALLVLISLTTASVALAQALPAIAPGAPPQALHVAQMPTPTVTIAAAGEYDINASGGTMDAQLSLIENGSVSLSDSDSGEGVDARIVAFLAPGTYGVRISEWLGRPMNARVWVSQPPPMTPVASIVPGAPPATVPVMAGGSPRESSAEVTLTIAAPGTYRLDAISADGSFDAELMLIQNGAVLQSDSDSGDGTNAQIVRQLTPGTYTLRVRDYVNRQTIINVMVAAQ